MSDNPAVKQGSTNDNVPVVQRDSDIDRDRTGRASFAVFSFITVVVLGLWFGSLILGQWGAIISLFISVAVISSSLKFYLASVDFASGLLALNVLKNEHVAFGPGLHFKYPWDIITEKGNISTEERTIERIDKTFATKTDTLIVTFVLQWFVILKLLQVFGQILDSAVNDGLIAPLERFLSSVFAHLTPDEVRKNLNLINAYGKSIFRGEIPKSVGVTEDDLRIEGILRKAVEEIRGEAFGIERKFGIRIALFNITDVDFSPEVRDARMAKAKGNPLLDLAYDFAGSKEEYDAADSATRTKWREEARVVLGMASERQLKISGENSDRVNIFDGGKGE